MNKKRYSFSVIAGQISQVLVIDDTCEYVGYARRVREMTEEEIEEMTPLVDNLPYGKAPTEWPPRKRPQVTEVGDLKFACSGNETLQQVICEVLDRIHLKKLMPKNRLELRKLIYLPTLTNLEQELTNGKLATGGSDTHEDLTRYLAEKTWRNASNWLWKSQYRW